MHTHIIIKCERCGTIIGQCRCPAKGLDEAIEYELCQDCKDSYMGKICPIHDGTCDRKCGYPAHATITRKNKEDEKI